MVSVKVLNKGWAKKDGEVWEAVPNTTLIEHGRKRIIVDPGCDPRLIDVLEMNSVWPEEIDTIFLTHEHLDHTANAALFKDAEIVDPTYIRKGIKMIPHSGYIPDTGIKIIQTPGHTRDHASLLVDTAEGGVLICGDLFWWTVDMDPIPDHDIMLSLPDEFAENRDILLQSRLKALRSNVKIFIPGHGAPFSLRPQG